MHVRQLPAFEPGQYLFVARIYKLCCTKGGIHVDWAVECGVEYIRERVGRMRGLVTSGGSIATSRGSAEDLIRIERSFETKNKGSAYDMAHTLAVKTKMRSKVDM